MADKEAPWKAKLQGQAGAAFLALKRKIAHPGAQPIAKRAALLPKGELTPAARQAHNARLSKLAQSNKIKPWAKPQGTGSVLLKGSAQENAQLYKVCPAGHAMQKNALVAMAGCDECGVELWPGQKEWGCRKCNYDLCKSCAAQARMSSTISQQRGQAWSKTSGAAKKAKKWGRNVGGGAGNNKQQQALAQALKNDDLTTVLKTAWDSLSSGAGGKQAVANLMPRILELAAKIGGSAQYAETLSMVATLGIPMDVFTFTKLCVILTYRVPTPTGLVRLTLNLAVPKDGQLIPLIPPNATEAEERSVFEDGEPINPGAALDGGKEKSYSSQWGQSQRGQSQWKDQKPEELPAKELGAQAEKKDEEEVKQARVALAKVNPADLRGLVKGRDDAHTAYFGHFAALLHLEAIMELQAIKRRLQRDYESLERFGHAVRGLKVREVKVTHTSKAKGGLPGREPGSKKSRLVLELPYDLDPSRLRMRPGDSILLSRTSPLKDLVCEGLVADAPIIEDDSLPDEAKREKSKPLVITLDGSINTREAQEGTWRLDKAANRTAYERQFQALVKLATEKEEKRLPVWECLPTAGVGGANVDAWAKKMSQMLNDKQKASLEFGDNNGTDNHMAALRTNIGKGKGGLMSTADRMASMAALKLKRLAAEEPATEWEAKQKLNVVRAELKRNNFNLNPSQVTAVSESMGRRLSLIQGPPGTGKTHVSVRLLWLWASKLRVKPLLATSDSNIAVDNIAEGARALGLKVTRVGRPEKVTSTLEELTLEAQMRQRLGIGKGKDGKGKDGKGKDAKGKGKGKESEEAAKARRVEEFEEKMKIIKEADVICTTTIAAGSDFLRLCKFGAILIDEVAQATELSAIVPLILRGAERFCLVGDHCQLPPSVLSLEAETRGLSLSIFGRLAAQGLDPYFLDTQFRMHPMIASFSAQEFYHGRLKTGIDASARPPPAGFDWPQRGSGIAFQHSEGAEQREGESRTNPQEAQHVLNILANVLRQRELGVLDIGIVSPYAAQVRSLRQTLRRELPGLLRGENIDLTGGLPGRQGQRALEIASVDAFQGREKELIIFSAVRSNRYGSVGFLQDWRRLNVMITRARRGLIVVGNTSTLSGDPSWGRWLQWAEQEKLIVGGNSQSYSSSFVPWSASKFGSSGSSSQNSSSSSWHTQEKGSHDASASQQQSHDSVVASWKRSGDQSYEANASKRPRAAATEDPMAAFFAESNGGKDAARLVQSPSAASTSRDPMEEFYKAISQTPWKSSASASGSSQSPTAASTSRDPMEEFHKAISQIGADSAGWDSWNSSWTQGTDEEAPATAGMGMSDDVRRKLLANRQRMATTEQLPAATSNAPVAAAGPRPNLFPGRSSPPGIAAFPSSQGDQSERIDAARRQLGLASTGTSGSAAPSISPGFTSFPSRQGQATNGSPAPAKPFFLTPASPLASIPFHGSVASAVSTPRQVQAANGSPAPAKPSFLTPAAPSASIFHGSVASAVSTPRPSAAPSSIAAFAGDQQRAQAMGNKELLLEKLKASRLQQW
jgi:hypothetical protein